MAARIPPRPTLGSPQSGRVMPDAHIRIKVGFFRHLKTLKLKRKLGPEGLLSLINLWQFAAIHKPFGKLDGMDSEDIAIVSEWSQDPDLFVQTLITIGWLDQQEDGTLAIHNWEAHQPHVVRYARHAEAPLPSDWNRRRFAVFIRDNFTCQYCGTRIEKPHCDHVTPRSRGGSDETDNLVTACPSCNLRKSAKTPEEWLQ